MVSKRVVGVINISLVLISFLLLLNLFGVTLPNLGQTVLDLAEPGDDVCFTSWKDQYSQLNLDLCCHEVKKQLDCDRYLSKINGFETDILCQTGSGDVLKYYLNSEAYRQCFD